MGNLLSRSSSRFGSGKTRAKRRKRDQFEQNETSVVGITYPNQNTTDYSTNNGGEYEKWNQSIDHDSLMARHSDPPGAPSTYGSQYASLQSDSIDPSWSTRQDVNNIYYPMTVAPSATLNYDRPLYNQQTLNNGLHSQNPPTNNEDRPSKKVHFDVPLQQASPALQTAQKMPLVATQSWHEPSVTIRDISSLAPIQNEPLVNTKPMHQPQLLNSSANNALSSNVVPKPIYVSIDHQAMIAERGLPAVNRHSEKSRDRPSSDLFNESQIDSHRPRSHTHHSHRSMESNDSSHTRTHVQSSRTGDTVTTRNSNSTRPTAVTASMSPSVHPSLNEQESRKSRTRGSRTHSALAESTVIPNNNASAASASSSRMKTNGQPPSQRAVLPRTESPMRTDPNSTTRRVEQRSSGSPMMRIPISQHQHQRQRQPQQQQQQQQQHSSATQRNNSPLRGDSRAHHRTGETRSMESPLMRLPISQQTQRHKPTVPPSSDRPNSTRTRV